MKEKLIAEIFQILHERYSTEKTFCSLIELELKDSAKELYKRITKLDRDKPINPILEAMYRQTLFNLRQADILNNFYGKMNRRAALSDQHLKEMKEKVITDSQKMVDHLGKIAQRFGPAMTNKVAEINKQLQQAKQQQDTKEQAANSNPKKKVFFYYFKEMQRYVKAIYFNDTNTIEYSTNDKVNIVQRSIIEDFVIGHVTPLTGFMDRVPSTLSYVSVDPRVKDELIERHDGIDPADFDDRSPGDGLSPFGPPDEPDWMP